MTSSALGSSDRPLHEAYDLVMLDLDGVVYVGSDAVPGAPEALSGVVAAGVSVAYITNNASRTAEQVAAHLREIGLAGVTSDDVVTSAQAVAHLVADAVPSGSAVLLIGGDGLRGPLEERGLCCVDTMAEGPVAVVQGYHPDVGWRQLAEASYAVGSGLPWFASNTDMTIPTARGIAPGNGSLVQAVRNATGASPVVAGKPEPALFRETLDRIPGSRPLMVGDRLDTDIDGAINAGIASLAVLTGVSDLQQIADAPRGHRPTYISRDLVGLTSPHPVVIVAPHEARCGRAVARHDRGVVRLVESGDDEIESLRALVGLAWAQCDIEGSSGAPVRIDGTLIE